MGLIDKILDNYFERKMRVTSGFSATPGWDAFAVNGTSASLPYGNGGYVKAYETSPELFAVLSFLIRKAASIPWYVYQVNKGTGAKVALGRYQTITKGSMSDAAISQMLIYRKAAYDENMVLDDVNNPVVRLIKRPNENMGMDQFIEAVIGFYCLSGEANVWGNSGNDPMGEIVELQVLPTQYLEDIYDKSDLFALLGHKFTPANQPIAKENIMRWKNWRPSFDAMTRPHMRGLSAVQVAWKNYLMSENAAEQAAMILKNGGSKGALSPQAINNMLQPMTPDQVSLAQQAVNQRFNGVSNAGNVGVLARPYDYLNFGLTSVDMQILETMKFSIGQWCRVLGLPQVLFDTEHTSDNNYQNAMRDLVTNTVVPMLSSFRDRFNNWLLPRQKQEGKLFIDFDVSALAEMQRDFEKLVNSLRQAYWWTEDEKRIAQGMEPKGGVYDTSLVPTGLTPIEMIGMDVSVDPKEEEDPLVDGKRALPY